MLWLTAAALMLVVAALMWRSLESYRIYFGMYHDDGIYLVTAKALAEGTGYRIASLPGEPYQTKYPIGFPLLHALIWAVAPDFPSNLAILAVCQALLGVAAAIVAVLYLWTTGKVTPWLALVILAATLLNYHYIDFAPMIMSDLPATLVIAAAFWATESAARKRFTVLRASLLGVTLALPALIRTLGLIAVPCAVLFLCLKRKFKLAAVSLLIAAVVIAPQFLWQAAAHKGVNPYLAFYTSYLGHAYKTLPGPAQLTEQIKSNYFWSGVLQVNTYFPFLGKMRYETLDPVSFTLTFRLGYFLIGLPLMIGGLRELLKGSLPGSYCFLYAAVLAYWPVKAEWRHILPMLAFNYYLYFRGFRVLARLVKPNKASLRRPYKMLCGACAVSFSLYLVIGTGFEAIKYAGQYGSGVARAAPWLGRRAQEDDNEQAFRWILTHTHRSDVFVCNNDPLLYLRTARKAIFPSPMEIWRFANDRIVDPGSLLGAIRFSRASYVMVDPTYRALGHATTQAMQSLATLSLLYPGAFVPVFTSSHGTVRIFAVNKERLPEPGRSQALSPAQ